VDGLFWRFLYAAAFVLAAVIFAAAVRRLGRGSGRPRAGLFMYGFRASALGVGAVLLWGMFWGEPRTTRLPRDSDDSKSCVIFLQDRSSSMEFPGTADQARGQLADEVWSDLRRLIRKARYSHVRCRRLYFADNVVEEDGLDDLAADATRLNGALSAALSGAAADAVVVASDGASEDGAVPPYLLNVMSNRNVNACGILAGDPEFGVFDFAVKSVTCETAYPDQVRAHVACEGESPGLMAVTFEVNGKTVAEKTLTPAGSHDIRFDVPELPKGWHAFAVRTRETKGEATHVNNVRYGVFQNAAPRGFLVVTERPSRESTHLVRQLKRLCLGRVDVVSVAASRTPSVSPGAYLLTVIGDVPPGKMPGRWIRAFAAGDAAPLIIGGRHLGAWCGRNMPGFPVKLAGKATDMLARHGMVGQVRDAWPSCDLMRLPEELKGTLRVNLFHRATCRNNCRTLLRLHAGGESYPLLVASPSKAPLSVVLLTDTTWKWALSSDVSARRECDRVFASFLRGVADARLDTRALHLEFQDMPERGSTMVRVHPSDPSRTPDLRKVRLRITRGDKQEEVEPLKGTDGWFHHLEREDSVVWVEAVASLAGKATSSFRKPLEPAPYPHEFDDTMLHPEVISSLAGRIAGREAKHGHHEETLEAMLDRLQPREPLRTRDTRRNLPRELMLAFFLLGLLGAEWYVERRLI